MFRQLLGRERRRHEECGAASRQKRSSRMNSASALPRDCYSQNRGGRASCSGAIQRDNPKQELCAKKKRPWMHKIESYERSGSYSGGSEVQRPGGLLEGVIQFGSQDAENSTEVVHNSQFLARGTEKSNRSPPLRPGRASPQTKMRLHVSWARRQCKSDKGTLLHPSPVHSETNGSTASGAPPSAQAADKPARATSG